MLTVRPNYSNCVANEFTDRVLLIVKLFVVLDLPDYLFYVLVGIIYDLIWINKVEFTIGNKGVDDFAEGLDSFLQVLNVDLEHFVFRVN